MGSNPQGLDSNPRGLDSPIFQYVRWTICSYSHSVWCGEQDKLEKTGCKVTCDAPTSLSKTLRLMKMDLRQSMGTAEGSLMQLGVGLGSWPQVGSGPRKSARVGQWGMQKEQRTGVESRGDQPQSFKRDGEGWLV